MSSIAFDSEQGSVRVGGRERARMGVLISDLSWVMKNRANSSLDPMENQRARFRWSGAFGEAEFGEVLGHVCLIANDRMKLLCHIHGQCEINGWVHPDDSEWFADLVEGAVSDGLLGPDGREGGVNGYGSWQDVADLARASTTPLVSSYSVTDSWPSPYLIHQYRPDLWTPPPHPDYPDEIIYESWYDLSEEERNRISDEALPDCAPRWWPDEWGTHWADRARGEYPWRTV